MNPDKELLDSLSKDYQDLRVLSDGTIVGVHDLMFTRALHIGLDRYGWERRYCYKDRELANKAAKTIQSGDDEPMAGYVASRT